MTLKDFTLIHPHVQASDVLVALQQAIPLDCIEAAIADSGSQQQRIRELPTSLVVSLVIAMSLWSKDSMRSVLKNLVDGLSRERVKVGEYWKVACRAAITQARQRVGPQVMSKLFHGVVRPLATEQTPGAFLGGRRVMLVDGTTLDVPDSEENARVFGYPGAAPGKQAAFPKVRLVLLVEAGTHLVVDALMCPYRMGERARAKKLLRSLTPDSLVMWDRGLHSYEMVATAMSRGSGFVGRVPANVKFVVGEQLPDGSYLSQIHPHGKARRKGAKPITVRVIEYTIEHPEAPDKAETYRLITNLMDTETFPATLLAQEYHQRWEVELVIDEVKTRLIGRKTPIRSKTPREVVQEVYGCLLGHWAVRSLMFQAATEQGIAPLRLSFAGSLSVVRRAVPKFQGLRPAELPFFTVGSSTRLQTKKFQNECAALIHEW